MDLQVKQVASRLTDRRITLDVTESAREWLADTGYDPAYGARPLRRLVQTEVGDQLARMLLAGKVKDGETVLVIPAVDVDRRATVEHDRRDDDRLHPWVNHPIRHNVGVQRAHKRRQQQFAYGRVQ